MPLEFDKAVDLIDAGYRGADIESANDMIGGVTYIGIPKSGEIVQAFYPYADLRSWYSFEYSTHVTNYHWNKKRSGIKLDFSEYMWFIKCPCSVFSYTPFITGTNRSTYLTFSRLIRPNSTTMETPEEVQSAVLSRHPIDEGERQQRSVNRRLDQLQMIEDDLRIKRAFQRADALRVQAGALASSNGGSLQVLRMFREANALRQQIQEYLDRGEPVPENLTRLDDIVIEEPPPRPAIRHQFSRSPEKVEAPGARKIVLDGDV